MKAHRLYLAAGVAVAVAAVALILPAADVAAAIAWLTPQNWHQGIALAIVAPLATLRTQHTEAVRAAEALEASITDGMAEADVTRIRGEHATAVQRASDLQRQIAEAETAERAAQTTQQATTTSPAAPAPSAPTAEEAIATERRRISDIRALGTRANLPADQVNTAIDGGETVEAFRVRAFDVLAERSRQAPTASVNASITRDERDVFRRNMAGAIVARLARAAGDRNVHIPEASRAYGEMGFAEMAAEAIGHRGHLRTARQVVEVFERAFHSTSDFPGIFTDAMNVRLLARYMAATPAFRLFCARYNANDFRQQNVVRAGDFPSLQRIDETGEIKRGTFSESKEPFQVYPYGVMLNISRQMLVNDNLSAIDQVLGSSGERVTDWENAQAFALLVSASNAGPTLVTDNTAVFATGHDNHVTSGTAISVTSVGLGTAAMSKKTSLDGIKLNLEPAVLMTGPDRYTEAAQLVAAITPATVSAVVPDYMKRLLAAKDANISGNHWYLFADVNKAPCFVYGNLQGFEGPRLSTDDPFTVQGVSIKLEHDFGVGAIDYRGAYHNAGAAPA